MGNTLMAIMPAYSQYVADRRGRSLIQYFGCHSMSLGWRCSGRVYFVVMRNFLPVKPWLVFDLKGATANRRALAAHLLDEINMGAGGADGQHAIYGTLRDWEWMDIAMSVDIPHEDKAALNEMISADAAFLSRQGLLDYSLLIGIHRLQGLDPVAHSARLKQLKAAGGYASVDRCKVYFFGIIDILERYTLRWQMQHMALSVGYHCLLRGAAADGISAMNPRDYADRFETFMKLELLGVTPSATPALGTFGSIGGLVNSDEGSPIAREIPARLQARTCCRRRYRSSAGTLENNMRWHPLWHRRRRGLVRERFEADRVDWLQRIRELERQLTMANVCLSPRDGQDQRVDAQTA